MIIITNRNLQYKKPPEQRFGQRFNRKGPDELRIATAEKHDGQWKVDIYRESISDKADQQRIASEHVFLKLQNRMKEEKKNCLFYIHGFNDDFEKVLERGHQLESNYGVEVIAFTWPANGRGDGGLSGRIGGLTSYKSDKRDALRSVIALDRALEKLNYYFTKHQEPTQQCHQRISLLLHSMGNYLFKHLLKSSVFQGETAIFDNIIMAAADVNNRDHAAWVNKITYRRRLYITINEDDMVLQASRMKFGEQQLARLGHYTQNLSSSNAVYLDFTETPNVGTEHAYFEGDPIQKNAALHKILKKMFNGEKVETNLTYAPHSNAYQVK